MRILCLGGGPAGLYFALLMKLQNPAHQVTVVERNRPFDTFGWGVVLSDQTLANLQAADAVSARLIGNAFNHWDDVEVFFKGRSVRSGGHGFCGIGRKNCLIFCKTAASSWALIWRSRPMSAMTRRWLRSTAQTW